MIRILLSNLYHDHPNVDCENKAWIGKSGKSSRRDKDPILNGKTLFESPLRNGSNAQKYLREIRRIVEATSPRSESVRTRTGRFESIHGCSRKPQ